MGKKRLRVEALLAAAASPLPPPATCLVPDATLADDRHEPWSTLGGRRDVEVLEHPQLRRPTDEGSLHLLAATGATASGDHAQRSIRRHGRDLALEPLLARYFAKPTAVFVRTAAEMAQAVRDDPFTDDEPSRRYAHFIDEQPAQAMLDEARGVAGERLALGPRLLYVSYGAGIGRTRLKLPAVKQGTARNMNSVARIAELLAEME